LISCDKNSTGCHGGSSVNAWNYILANNITDETCSRWQGWGYDNGLPCS